MICKMSDIIDSLKELLFIEQVNMDEVTVSAYVIVIDHIEKVRNSAREQGKSLNKILKRMQEDK